MEREKAIEILEHNWTSLHNPDYTDEELAQALDVAIVYLNTDAIPRERIDQMTTEIEDYLWNIPSDDVSLKVINNIRSIIDKYIKEQDNEQLCRSSKKDGKRTWL